VLRYQFKTPVPKGAGFFVVGISGFMLFDADEAD
jgi:hypothetical protein